MPAALTLQVAHSDPLPRAQDQKRVGTSPDVARDRPACFALRGRPGPRRPWPAVTGRPSGSGLTTHPGAPGPLPRHGARRYLGVPLCTAKSVTPERWSVSCLLQDMLWTLMM